MDRNSPHAQSDFFSVNNDGSDFDDDEFQSQIDHRNEDLI